MDVASYARQLKALLPRGAVWKLEPESELSKLLTALAQELARVDGRAEDVVNEWDPRTALELLSDWEEMLGLPDDVFTEIPASVGERRTNILSRLLARGGASHQYFIDVAAVLGFTITISEYTVSRSGTLKSGDPIYGIAWAYAWLVTVDLSSTALEGWEGQTILFRSGQSVSGDPIRSWNGPYLEALFRKLKPAHTLVLFEYS